MKNAIIYSRVSSDEQAKGYSLGYQEEQLRKYCDLKGINVIQHYSDDYSGKDFDRPSFNKIMAFCKKNKKSVDYLLFTNWSRFGRNVAEAFRVINLL